MIILTNSLVNNADEGCLKVASSLVKRIKAADADAFVVSYERESELSDIVLPINRLLIDFRLIRLIFQRKEPVLYIPFPAKMISNAVRIFVLSLFARWGLNVVMVMEYPMGSVAAMLMKISGATIITLSRSAWKYYDGLLNREVHYIKGGVDTSRFQPANKLLKQQLRIKYGIPIDKPVVLHVGHLSTGRNIEHLTKINQDFHILLVVSTLTADEQDKELKRKLLQLPNLTLIESYIPNIEEVYQLSDVYFFPVVELGNCIDIPLSVMEAAACNIPVVMTAYGELKEFIGKEGFHYLKSFQQDDINGMLKIAAAECGHICTRNSVSAYDWNCAVSCFLKIV